MEVPNDASEVATDSDIQTFPLLEENGETDYEEETEDPLDGLEYMTNCQVVVNKIHSVKKEVDEEPVIKRTRRKMYVQSYTSGVEKEPSSGEKQTNSKANKDSKPKRKLSGIEKANRKRRSLGFGRKRKNYQQQKILKMVNLKEFKKKLVETTNNTLNDKEEPLESSSENRFKWVICCGIRFFCQYELSNHKRTKHNNADSIPCELCQKVVVIEEMSNHLFQIHRIKPAHFDKAFQSKEIEVAVEISVEENKKNIEGDNGEYTCEFCGSTIFHLDEFLPHMMQHKEYHSKRGPNKLYPIVCCNITFENADSYKHHRREKHNKAFLKVQCKFCDLIVPNGYIKGHLKFVHRYAEEKPIQCPKCDLTFVGDYSLSYHQKNAGHEEDVQCDVANCKKVCKTLLCLRKHKQFFHFGELKYACKFCGKLYRYSSARHEHELQHETEFKFMCDECGKAFKIKRHLSKHLKRHEKLDRENFKCKDCGKNFKHSQGLKKHIRIFHREDLKKCFTCELCGKMTNNMTNMRIHQRIHDTNRVFNTKKRKSATTPAKSNVVPPATESVIVSN